MPRSFRIGPDLERKLCMAAERQGISVSAMVREAIENHCNAVLGKPSLLEEMADYIGVAEGDGSDYSSRTGEAFTDLLIEKQERRRRAAVDDPH